MIKRRGFSVFEIVVVVAIFILILGVVFYKYRSDRVAQLREVSRVDKQQSMRRFLMLFSQDMQAMDNISRFAVSSSPNPAEDSRVIETVFERYIDETGKSRVAYTFDPNQRKIFRFVDNRPTNTLDSIVSFQLYPYDYGSQRILDMSQMQANLYFFEVRIFFTDQNDPTRHAGTQEFWMRIYPRLKAAQNKASFNQFRLNPRF